MKGIGVIPARFGSSRFPGKPLADIGGIPMVVRVMMQAAQCRTLSRIVAATDHEKIAEAVRNAGFDAVMTSSGHPTGTDRICEIATAYPAEFYVNIQGDEPFLPPGLIDRTAEILELHPEWDVATTAAAFESVEEWMNPNRVKVICTEQSEALYFTRAAIPWNKNGELPSNVFRHLGLYVYRRNALLRFRELDRHPVEISESLEQLRLLMNGFRYGVVLTNENSPSVDTPEDLEAARKMLNA